MLSLARSKKFSAEFLPACGEGGGGVLLSDGLLVRAAGWGRIFTTGLTIMGLSFQAFSIELLEWGHAFSGL